MRKRAIIALLCTLLLALPGCKTAAQETFQVDTVVRIPMNPEETETEATAAAEQTEAPTEPEPTVPETTAPAASSGKTTGSKSSSSGKSSSSSKSNSSSSSKKDKNVSVKETEPPAAEVTQPPETVPPETEDPAAAIYDISDYAVGSIAYAFLDEINACRAEAELDALSLDSRLSAIASVRAYEASVYWSSSRPDGRGGASVMGDYGYGYGSAAEHLCYGGDAASMVTSWMGSDAHKANLLSSSFTKLGVGEYNSGGIACVAVLFVG